MTRGEHNPLKTIAAFFWACIMGSIFAAGIISGLMFMHKVQSMLQAIK